MSLRYTFIYIYLQGSSTDKIGTRTDFIIRAVPKIERSVNAPYNDIKIQQLIFKLQNSNFYIIAAKGEKNATSKNIV